MCCCAVCCLCFVFVVRGLFFVFPLSCVVCWLLCVVCCFFFLLFVCCALFVCVFVCCGVSVGAFCLCGCGVLFSLVCCVVCFYVVFFFCVSTMYIQNNPMMWNRIMHGTDHGYTIRECEAGSDRSMKYAILVPLRSSWSNCFGRTVGNQWHSTLTKSCILSV